MKYKLIYKQQGNNYTSGTIVKEMTFKEMKDKIITYSCMDDEMRRPDLRSLQSIAIALEPDLIFVRAIKVYD